MNYLRLVTTVLAIGVSVAGGGEFAPTNRVDGCKNLKIVNWNVIYGFNHKGAIEQGSRWINNQDPDVVALQELNGNTAESLKELAGKWGHRYSVILKQKGFPVGLTSNKPIEVVERRVDGFHHGYLHCKTQGINFFIVHFWPKKDHEAAIIIEKTGPLLAKNENVIVLGDFNTHSRKDSAYLSTKPGIEPLYAVVDLFEANAFVDLVYKHDKEASYSFPSPITIPRWSKSLKEVESKQQRIDFVFADKALQKFSTSGTILKSKELDEISDHYPVVVEFKLPLNEKKEK